MFFVFCGTIVRARDESKAQVQTGLVVPVRTPGQYDRCTLLEILSKTTNRAHPLLQA